MPEPKPKPQQEEEREAAAALREAIHRFTPKQQEEPDDHLIGHNND